MYIHEYKSHFHHRYCRLRKRILYLCKGRASELHVEQCAAAAAHYTIDVSLVRARWVWERDYSDVSLKWKGTYSDNNYSFITNYGNCNPITIGTICCQVINIPMTSLLCVISK